MADVSARTWATTAAETDQLGLRTIETSAAPPASRGHELAMLALLLTIAGTILVLAVTLGRS